MDYRILGPLEVHGASGPVALDAAKLRVLLAALLLRPNEAVSVDRLAEALWGERQPAGAPNTLQVYVGRLRKALGSERVVTRPPGYAVLVEPGELDLDRFERLAAKGRQALADGRARAAAARLRSALSLWRGPPLADLRYEDFAQPEIERLEESRLAATEDRIEAELALGRHPELVPELEQLVDEHPLRERLRGQLMLALYRAGRQAEAIDAYQQARLRLLEDLGIDPTPELQELHRQILNQDPALTVEPAQATPLSNLPAQPTQFIGRDRELAELCDLLRREDVRLVTVTGAGGSGKTRLALQAAALLFEQFPEGAWFVNLGALTDPRLVVPTVAQALGVKERPGETILETLTRYLVDKELLLLLDNFEQVSEAAPLLADLFSGARKLKLLVTSRAPLHLSAEREYPVSPLTTGDALALFVDRAQVAKPNFSLDGNRAVVAEICRRLDHLPLAIELAAARIKLLPEEALLSRLGERFKLLTGGARDVDERQRTLRAAIDWSYDLLLQEERALFCRLSVFAGGWTLEAADAVCNADGEANVLDELGSLLDKNLIRQTEVEGEPRFSMLETISEYAAARLTVTDDAGDSCAVTALRRRHALYYLALAEQAEPELRGGAQRFWLERLELDHDNLRGALLWSEEAGEAELGLRTAAALWRFWRMHNHLAEGRRTLERFLRIGEDAPTVLKARALLGASRLAMDEGDVERGLVHAKEALAAARRSRAAREIAATTENVGLMMILAGDVTRAIALLEESISRFRALSDPVGAADALNNLANALLATGETCRATELGEEGLALQRDAGNELGMAFVLNTLGYVALHESKLELARVRLEEALVLFNELGDLARLGGTLEGLAHVAAGRGDHHRAVVLWAAGESLRAEAGKKMEPPEAVLHEAALSAARMRLGEPAFALAWAEGAALTPKGTIAYALATNGLRKQEADAASIG